MSASFNQQDREWLLAIVKQGVFSEKEKAVILATFDEQTQFDIAAIKKEREARRVSLYKLIIHPFDIVLTRLMLGAEAANNKRILYNIYKSYYKNKISYTEFNKRLVNYNNDVKLGNRY